LGWTIPHGFTYAICLFTKLIMKDAVPKSPHRKFPESARASCAIALLAGGLSLAIVGVHLFDVSPHPALSAWVTMCGLGMTTCWAMASFRPRFERRLARLLHKPADWLGVGRHQLLMTLTGLNLSIAARAAAGDGPMVQSPLAVPLWLSGIVLTILGCRSVGKDPSPRKATAESRYGRVLEIAAVALLFTGSLLLRGMFAAQAPHVLSGDEGSAGLYGWEFVQGDRNNLLGLGWFSFPALYFWFLSISQALFGRTVEAIRWVSALAGALTVASLYWMGRRWWNRRVAIWSALWLATFHHHIFFSRVAYNNIWDGLFYVLAVGALWVGVTQSRRSAYLLAGAAIGLGQYFYTTSHLGLVLILLWVFHLISSIFGDGDQASGLACSVLTAASVAMPLALLYGTHPEMLLFTSSRVSMLVPDWLAEAATALGTTPIGLILEQAWVTLLGFNVAELQGVYYGSGMPLLFGLSAFCAYLGLAWALVRIRDPRCSLLWITILGTVIVGGLSIQAPNAQRMLLLPPMLALAVAYALEFIYQTANRYWRSGAIISALLLTALLLAGMFQNARFFFLDYLTRERYGSLNGEVSQAMIELLREQPEQTNVYFLGGERMAFHSIPSLPYLLPEVQGQTIDDPSELATETGRITGPIIVIVLPEESSALEKILDHYSSESPVPIYNRYGKLLFYFVRGENP
jgi:4-amino-4-deoxy-L-arabinose transferase-like glycosyltransferase